MQAYAEDLMIKDEKSNKKNTRNGISLSFLTIYVKCIRKYNFCQIAILPEEGDKGLLER